MKNISIFLFVLCQFLYMGSTNAQDKRIYDLNLYSLNKITPYGVNELKVFYSPKLETPQKCMPYISRKLFENRLTPALIDYKAGYIATEEIIAFKGLDVRFFCTIRK